MYEIKFTERDDDGRSTMQIFHNGEMLYEYWDGGEPEDNYFFRDWNWVEGALKQAYALGLRDGKASA